MAAAARRASRLRALITGISGFVGRALVGTLCERGHEVAGTFIEERKPDVGIELYRADLLDPEALTRAVTGFGPDRIIHLAGLSHVGRSFECADRYHLVNVTGTSNLISAAGGVPIVLASSSEVYGSVPDEEQPIGEGREPSPDSPYAESKVASEKLVLAADGLVVRSFNIIGPGQKGTFALPSFTRQLAEIERGEREPILRVGNLDVWRDFTHIDDATEGYAVLLERAELGIAYNLGSGRAQRIGDLLKRLIEISGLEVTVELDPDRFRPVDAVRRIADNSRIRSLGWEPRRTVEGALEAMWRVRG